MRLVSFVVVFALVSSVALAQTIWQHRVYKDMGFSVDFPVDPKNPNNIAIEDGVYTASEADDGPKSKAPARIYTVTLPTAIYKVTVADFSKQADDGATLLGEAVDYLTNTENLRVDTSARIGNRAAAVYGRDLTYDRKDGSRSTLGFFFTKGKLYVIEAIILPTHDGGDVGSPDAARFQQSLCLFAQC